MNVINIQDKLQSFSEQWSPKIIGKLNGQYIKLAKLQGDFIWHQHEHEDELFYVLSGLLKMEFSDKIEYLQSGEMIIVPRGVEHKPSAETETCILLFEPCNTLNTGDKINTFTKEKLDEI